MLFNVVKVSNSQPLYTKKASREVMIGTVLTFAFPMSEQREKV